MQWIRENLFLACLAGVVVVVGGMLLAIGMVQNAGFADDMAPRQKAAKRLEKLKGFFSRFEVSQRSLGKKAAYLETIRNERDRGLKDAVAWNRRNYRVLELPLGGGRDPRKVPAFPVDVRLYRDEGLTYVFTDEYGKVLAGHLARLEVTRPPTDEEISAEAKTWSGRIQAKRESLVSRVREALRKMPPPKKGEPRTKPETISDDEWALYQMTAEQIAKQAHSRAEALLVMEKADAGLIYASMAVLDVVFPHAVAREADAPYDLLWAAQINLWVSDDILSAIDKTNRDSLQVEGGRSVVRGTVPNSAIKRLCSLNIAREYVMGREARTVKAPKAGKKKTVAPGPPRRSGCDSLTMRSTCEEYEIVRYAFGVIMNTRHLPDLQRNLLSRGDHAVLGVNIADIISQDLERRYYGPEAVMRVKVTGEVLMRSAWTRGTWEVTKDDRGKVLHQGWSRDAPPLMPVRVLPGISRALRPEDHRRLSQR